MGLLERVRAQIPLQSSFSCFAAVFVVNTRILLQAQAGPKMAFSLSHAPILGTVAAWSSWLYRYGSVHPCSRAGVMSWSIPVACLMVRVALGHSGSSATKLWSKHLVWEQDFFG